MDADELNEKIKTELGILDLPLYKVEAHKSRGGEKYHVERPDGTWVNDWEFDTEKKASIYLERLEAFKYCRRQE